MKLAKCYNDMMKKRDVAVLILNDKGKILLQKRSRTAKRFPLKWGLFGGGIEEGESPERGLKREIVEELELKLNEVHKIYELAYTLAEKSEAGTIYAFYANYDKEKLSLNEGDEMKWVEIDEALTYDLSPDYRKIIEYVGQNREVMVL
jgi:mutator protein MutT